METLIVLWRFILTFLLSFAFGLERQMDHKPVGFGTFIFVATGACGLAILSTIMVADAATDNPLPLLGAIITGIGFLGAGAMMKTGDRIVGATTAAGIWIFAIFGIFMGLGYYQLAMLAYGFVWVVVFSDKFFEKRGIGNYRSKITICSKRPLVDSEVEAATGAKIYAIDEIDVDKGEKVYRSSYFLEGSKKKIRAIPEKIRNKDWFISVKLEVYGR
jgi:putative Mg2+ transporter-C (MgtC) family protein